MARSEESLRLTRGSLRDQSAPLSRALPEEREKGWTPGMKRLLIVFHSATGGTRQMAEAAARGAAQAEIAVTLRHALDAGPQDVLAADGYIFASPENLAAISGLMKDFFDRTYYAALDRINGRPYAVLVCAGSDGQNANRQITRIATGWRLRAIAEPVIICTHAQTPEAILAPKVISAEDLQQCEELGAALATGMAMGVF
jgi:NAD(P)H-dependent FMN reductase